MRQTFKKEERLCSRLHIETLFTKGKSFSKFPFKILYHPEKLDTSFPVQVMLSVSKRKFKRAVDRNKIKRFIREGYRKNKYIIYNYLYPLQKQYSVAIIYISDKIMPCKIVEEKLIVSLMAMCEQLNENNK